MSKYDFEVDLSWDTSTGIILNKIKPKSIVLEFGCAAGRMTRYMRNALDCQVYIVEYDKEAYNVAIQYAADGVCDDILTLSWLDKFKGIEFDSIIFADVLEHLAKPDIALRSAAKLLKQQGEIYASIPNIAHNDILLKLFSNHFDYTKVGLLDDTHVHFWGYENIVPFVENCGLFVHSIEATYLSTGQTEQYRDTTIQCSSMLFNYFNERKFAEAYQFVIDIGKKEKGGDFNKNAITNCKKNFITSHLYIDDGEGFNEKKIIAFESENVERGRYVAHYVFNDVKGVKKLRFDPIELQGCILQNLSFRQAGKELNCVYLDYLKLTEGTLMIGTDPMVFTDLISETDSVIIDADIVIFGDEYLNILKNTCIYKYSENESLQGEINGLNEQRENLAAHNKNLQGEIKGLSSQNENLQAEINGLNVRYESLNRQNRDLNEQNERLNGQNKDLNDQNERLNQQNRDLYEQNEKLNGQNKGLHEEIKNLNAQTESLYAEMNTLKIQNEEIQDRLAAYILLANKKDESLIKKDECLIRKDKSLTEKDNYIISLERRIEEIEELSKNRAEYIISLEHRIEEKDRLLNDRAEYITNLEQQVDYYKNRRCIKICNSFWKIYWSIRLKLRSLIRKETKDE